MIDSNELATRERAFLSVVEAASNELGTPLRNVRQGLAWLRDDLAGEPGFGSPHDSLDTIEFITTTTRHLEAMLAGISRLGHVLAHRPRNELFAPADALVHARRRLRVCGSAASTAETASLRGTDQLAIGDLELTTIALEELLRNADVHRHPARSARVAIEARLERRWIVLDVVDNAEGVDPSQHDRIFEPLARLSARRANGPPGAGMGLTIARAAVTMQDGSLHLADSSPDGSHFELALRRGEA